MKVKMSLSLRVLVVGVEFRCCFKYCFVFVFDAGWPVFDKGDVVRLKLFVVLPRQSNLRAVE